MIPLDIFFKASWRFWKNKLSENQNNCSQQPNMTIMTIKAKKQQNALRGKQIKFSNSGEVQGSEMSLLNSNQALFLNLK